jgi:hypothetical protein
MDTLVNKVAESSLTTINLEAFLPKNLVMFDMKSFLFMELILKEKDFRASLLEHDWLQYQNKNVFVTCTADLPLFRFGLICW